MSYIIYDNYQRGGGGRAINSVYVGSRYQRGHGFGGFLGGLLRSVLPYLKSGARFVGKEALKTGIIVIEDIENKGVGFNEALKERSKESIKNLKRKAVEKMGDIMQGKGYKKGNKKRKRQSVKKRVKRKKKVVKRLNSKKRKKPIKKSNKKKKTGRKQKLRTITAIFGQ